jgi:hypothetical protein
MESRHARKRAEEDVKLLANRIQLLKMEEKKVVIVFNSLGLEKDRRHKEKGTRYHACETA